MTVTMPSRPSALAETATDGEPRRLHATPPVVAAVLSIVFSGAIFGFFFAWVCSTMWGLDDADPRVAIAAMQTMNASVRNGVFAPAFFGTPFVLLATALIVRRTGRSRGARWFVLAAAVYAVGGLILTLGVNVPMNEDLATKVVPGSEAGAAEIWSNYSPRWQVWNITRTVASGLSLVIASLGAMTVARRS